MNIPRGSTGELLILVRVWQLEPGPHVLHTSIGELLEHGTIVVVLIFYNYIRNIICIIFDTNLVLETDIVCCSPGIVWKIDAFIILFRHHVGRRVLHAILDEHTRSYIIIISIDDFWISFGKYSERSKKHLQVLKIASKMLSAERAMTMAHGKFSISFVFEVDLDPGITMVFNSVFLVHPLPNGKVRTNAFSREWWLCFLQSIHFWLENITLLPILSWRILTDFPATVISLLYANPSMCWNYLTNAHLMERNSW